MTKQPKDKEKRVKAWAVLYSPKQFVRAFMSKQDANEFAMRDDLIVPCTITYHV